MNQISRQIAFNQRRQDGKDIPAYHLEELDKKAIELIEINVSEGNREGQLVGSIGDVEYIGYWMIHNN